jgi:hypothetical protein
MCGLTRNDIELSMAGFLNVRDEIVPYISLKKSSV